MEKRLVKVMVERHRVPFTYTYEDIEKAYKDDYIIEKTKQFGKKRAYELLALSLVRESVKEFKYYNLLTVNL